MSKAAKKRDVKIPQKNKNHVYEVPPIVDANIDNLQSNSDSWDDLFSEIMNSDIAELKKNIFETDLYMVKKTQPAIIVEAQMCHSCNVELKFLEEKWICTSCGVEANKKASVSECDYAHNQSSINKEGFMEFKVSGPRNLTYGLQKNYLRTCASYQKYGRGQILKYLRSLNSERGAYFIPTNIINMTSEMYEAIKDRKYVYRNGVAKGVLSAIMYYICYQNEITRTPTEMATYFNIDEKFHSGGDRILHTLHEEEVIQIPIKVDPITNYVERYMALLEIDKVYKPFVLALIARAEQKNIHMLHDSKNNTKCCAAIYMLVCRVEGLRQRITKEMIEEQCHISSTTFIRYYTTICNYYKKFKKVFKRHGIPMPIKWKD